MKKVIIPLLCLLFPLFLISQNNALNFDGVNDFANLGDPAYSDFGSSNFTVEFWVNKQANTNNFNHSFGVNKWDNGGANRGGNEWVMSLGAGASSNNPSFVLESGNTSYPVISSQALQLNTWTHLAGVRDGDEIRIYFNGQLNNTSTLPPGLVVNNVGRRIEIAVNHRKTRYSRASFDELRIWGRAVSEAEIQANMGCQSSGSETGLLAYFDFNQGIAGGNNAGLTTLLDRTNNGNNGTLVNSSLNGGASNWVAGNPSVTGICLPFNANTVPTLSQWGLILLGLIVLSLGSVAVWRARRKILPSADR